MLYYVEYYCYTIYSMESKLTPKLHQEYYKALHRQALLDGVTDEEALAMIKEAGKGYIDLVDQARAERDIAKLRYRLGDVVWGDSIAESSFLLLRARNKTEDEDAAPIVREMAATQAMKGRLDLSDRLTKDSDTGPSFVALEIAARLIHESSREILPDQYEINFAAARVIAERYSEHDSRGFRTLARAALIAPFSETRFARHNTPGLSIETRRAARKRSIARTAFAARLVFASNKYIQRSDVRQKAAEIVV